LVGVAEAPPRPFTYGETPASIRAVVEDIFEPVIVGYSPLEREAIHAKLNRTVANPTAKAAIDMALWDVIGKSLDVSVTELLGGFTDRMRVCHMLGFAAPEQMVDEAERIRDTYGITTFKVKVGRNPFSLDVEVCRALREALGPQVELYIDGNRGWTASDAARALRAMSDLDLTLAEELNPPVCGR
jgi:L-alanine-DL-glutamate epimerase-like enolase superfamily enzyme